jgi:hypothetical protein
MLQIDELQRTDRMDGHSESTWHLDGSASVSCITLLATGTVFLNGICNFEVVKRDL